jgi:peptidoglycan/LPS O-acetylase OafA/YrhL
VEADWNESHCGTCPYREDGNRQRGRFTVERDAATVQEAGFSGTADHNLTLDWLRGVAAIAVVAFHFGRRLNLPDLFGHGYLAVDFFFVLSGFVIAKAYGKRLDSGKLSGWSFFLTRAIRLLPMVVVGTLLAAVVEIGRPGITDQTLHLREGLTALVLGSILVPVMWTSTLETTVFPLNGPMWTLFLEAVSNVAFVPWAKMRLGLGWVYGAMAVSFPFLIYGAWKTGATEFGAVPATFALGFARIGWSFSMGILLYNFRSRAPRANAAVVTLALVALLAVPDLGRLNPVFDLGAVLIVLPTIVFAAAASSSNARWAEWSGNLSYPLYAMHYPLVRLLGVIGLKLHLSTAGRLGFAAAGLAGLVVASLMAFLFYDRPTRTWLTAKRRKGKPAPLA